MDELRKIKWYTGGRNYHFLTEEIMGGITTCSVIFTSSLGRQDYILAQICCIKERRTVARYGVLGTRDERWPSNLLSDDPGNALGTRQSSYFL